MPMARRLAAAVTAASLLAAPAAQAENQMGYQLVDARQAASLPRGGGSLGLEVGRGRVITDSGMTFELLKVQSVRRGSPAAQAGLNPGDQVIAVDGKVFPSVASFGGYVGSMPPGRTLGIDYLPRNGGPEQAQRVGVTLASAGGRTQAPAPAPAPEPESHGLSTGQKIAIGAGAIALFGCYKMGCFNRRTTAAAR